MGIEPDGIIGHSIGEICSGYADGCLTRGEALKLAYHRGNTVMQNKEKLCGKMVAVQLSLAQVKARCTEGVVAACHNGANSITVSGESNEVETSLAIEMF